MLTIRDLFFLVILTIAIISCSTDGGDDDSTSPSINNPPEIQSVTASPSTIASGKKATLNCVATDADGDNLTITWSANEGSFPNGASGSPVQWQAPALVGTKTINVTVSDGKETDQGSVSVMVEEGGTGWFGDTCVGIPTVTYAGKTYNTVQIGEQCWLRENLDVGTRIDVGKDMSDNGTIEKYCYDDDPANCETYGGFYQWHEAMQYIERAGEQGICPPGWHIPTLDEFNELDVAVHQDGNALKAIGQGYGIGAGTNTSNFSALLSGYVYDGWHSWLLGSKAFFWCSTPYNVDNWMAPDYELYMGLYADHEEMVITTDYETHGMSVRCVQD